MYGLCFIDSGKMKYYWKRFTDANEARHFAIYLMTHFTGRYYFVQGCNFCVVCGKVITRGDRVCFDCDDTLL